jgi:hypothetical protein
MLCCEPEGTSQAQDACCECGPVCCPPHGMVRRFVSAKEKQECLEQYKEQLEKEIAGVNERIQKMKNAAK